MLTWLRRMEFVLAALGFWLAVAAILETAIYLFSLFIHHVNLIGAPIVITPVVWVIAAFVLLFPVAGLSCIEKTFFRWY